MNIRKADRNDVKDISRIHALSWKKAYKGMLSQDYLDNLEEDFWVSAFDNWITSKALTVQLIFDKNEPIGCIAYGKSRDNTLPDWAEIVSIYVLPEYFGRGCGKSLLHYALSDLKTMGYDHVFLWVLDKNHQAQIFYKKNGFSETNEQIPCEISGQQLIDYRYTLQLT
ncbi:GNAT family N-acetyltransferase [Aminipila sp.]|uniref:GNAT family N-acetyltransferase n=1 Tax=Aminipila sp. TaxID=2060095 RepID=UPI00289EBD21|nr:GNAT family N-acetyltransferase [Aminipila sp.]